ncbi:MAG TPA: BlaI/MecI/CopY family transcriptional regulator [bacterium]|nr:BlaI/MecI/CopY family transcriptional regulator [bacterium]HQL61103.1 BlaI/MecI/CopY family transcriptional regulator [bacterium]
MPRQRSKIFSEREISIMNAVWDLRKASINDIRNHLGGARAGAYTSVATMVRFLEKKGALKHTIAGRMYYYEARISRERAAYHAVRYVLRTYFRNNSPALFRACFSKEAPTEEEKQEILRFLAGEVAPAPNTERTQTRSKS